MSQKLLHRFNTKLILILAVMIYIFSVSAGFADDDLEGDFAPLSPEFLQWQKEYLEQEAEQDSNIPRYYSTPQSEHPNGYIPIPVDFSHLANNPPIEDADTSPVLEVKSNVGADSLPSTFDLRNVDGKSYVSSVKSQNPYGTCWAHAAMGSMESNYMMQGNSELDLSEMQTAWFTYRNSDKSRAFKNYSSASFKTVMDLGGNALYPTALAARLSGPTTEASLPYGSTQPSQSTPESYPRVLRLRDSYYLIMGSNNVNSNEEERNIVKRRIMQNGAVVANYYNDDKMYRKAASGNTSYHTTGKKPNHAVQIIGWDDNYSASNFKTKPSINGAWLIKNSWGERWYTNNGYMGDNGCFWMSYATYLVDGTSFVVEAPDDDMKVYEYDPLGICALWGSSGNTIYAANVFRSERDERLTEVGFYTGDNNLDYEINIYTGMSTIPASSPINGSSVSTSTGTIAFAGYHTIALDTPVSISSGECFSVVVKFTGYGRVPVEAVVSGFSNNAKIETGSFFSTNGSSWATGTSKKINACIKAFTVTSSAAGTKPKISDSYPPDAQVNEAYSAVLKASGTKPITWSITGGTLPAGLTIDANGIITGTPTETGTSTFTLTASNAYGTDSRTFTMSVVSLPAITTVSLDGYAGYAFTGQIQLNRTIDTKWKAESSMPSGLKINAKTGAVTGKPRQEGEYTVSIKATTSYGDTYKDVKFVIYEKPEKPVINTKKFEEGYIDTFYSQDLSVSGTYPITVYIEGLPNTLSVDRDTGVISGTPTAAGTYSIKLTAENLATSLDNRPVTKTLKLVIKAHPPVIDFDTDSEHLPYARVGNAYTPYTFELSAGTAPVTWKASGLPAGMKFSNGTLSGTPTKAGDFKITLNVSNTGGKATLKIPFTVLQAPLITTPKLANATTDKKYSAKITAKGTTPISWDISGLPDTLTYSYNAQGTTLTISGTPTEIATYALTITASGGGGTSTVTATLKVNGVAPKITAALKKGTVDSSYDGSNISAKGTSPITFGYSISASDQKKFGISSLSDLGLSFDYDSDECTAEITGTPTKSVKALPITITADNAATNGKPVSKTVRLTIAGEKPSFTEPSDATVNITVLQKAAISINFTVTGTPDITFSMNKVSGFTLTQTGDNTATLTGTAPSRDGRTAITITAANGDGKATRKINIQTMSAPVITTTSLPKGTVNKNYNTTLKATGTKTITWSVDGDLPSGMRFSKGRFSGKPTEGGTFTLTVTAENDVGTATKEFTLKIAGGNVTSVPEEEPEYADESIYEETEAKAETENEIKSESESENAITFGHERDANSISTGQSDMLSDGGYVIVKILPEMKVSDSKMYDINVEFDDNAETGAKLFWFAFPKNKESSSDDEIAEFYDESGAEITCVPESHKITVSAWLTEGITYEPVITVKSEK